MWVRLMVDMLIKNAKYVVTMDAGRRIIRGGAVALDGTKIVDVGKSVDLERKYSAETVIDAKDKVVLPGFVNVHTHAGSAINRGVCDDLPNVLHTIFLPLEGQQTKEERQKIARAGLLDDVKSGTTCVGDDLRVAEDVWKIGLRGVLNMPIRDADTTSYDFAHHLRYSYKPEIGEKMVDEGLCGMRMWDGAGNGRITCHFGPHAPDYCSKELLERVRDLANKHRKRVTIHLAQNPQEVHQVQSLYSKTPVEFLRDIGFLELDIYAAHCMYLSPSDTETLKQANTRICHSPLNTVRFRGCVAPLLEWINLGMTVGLCTDGAGGGDMLEFGKAALALQRARAGQSYPLYLIRGGPPPKPMKILEMMTIDAARVLGLEKEIGSLEVGKKADVILLDIKKPHLTPMIDPIGSIIHYAFGSDVDTSIIDGKIVMANRMIRNVNEQEVLEQAQEAGERTYAKFQEKFRDHIEAYGIYKMPDI